MVGIRTMRAGKTEHGGDSVWRRDGKAGQTRQCLLEVSPPAGTQGRQLQSESHGVPFKSCHSRTGTERSSIQGPSLQVSLSFFCLFFPPIFRH